MASAPRAGSRLPGEARLGIGIAAALAVGAMALVGATLRRPEPATFAPSPIAPREVGGSLAGPLVYTIDASDERRWRFFDFSRGSRVEPDDPLGWDLAFRRSRIVANGGKGLVGRGGIADLGEVPFAEVVSAPIRGYAPTSAGRDTTHPATDGWYDYGFTTHLLTPRPRVYAVRTADGRYAKFEILSYYCPGPRPGCLTFRYTYQGGGSTRLIGRGERGAS